MTQYIIRRLWQSVFVVFGVVTVVFFVLQLTGDPVRIMMGETASEEDIQNVRQQLGLDRPIHEQYVVFLGKAVRGDFGESIRQRGQPAMGIVLEPLPSHAPAGVHGAAFSVILATIFGIISAVKRYSLLDNVVMFMALFGQSVPNFWLGIMLILILAVQLGWLPSQGYGDGGLRYLILPMLTLAAPGLARLTRLVRSGMLEIMGQDYVRTARAKGLHERRRDLRARAEERRHPAGDGDRARHGRAARRRGRDRADLRLARRGPGSHHRDQRPRLPGRPGGRLRGGRLRSC